MTNALAPILDHFSMNRTDHPYWTESSWFSWAIPERDINGLVWNHFRPNMNCVCGGPAMWDRSGQHVWEFRFFDWQAMRVPPPGQWGVDYDKYDFLTDWSMRYELLEPLKSYRISYDRAGFRLELVFTAIAPPNLMEKPDIALLKNAFKVHFEQPGRMRGFVELDGERMEVDCYSIRDGGHGPRFLEAAEPGGYTWSTADDGTGWHVLAPNAGGGPVAKAIAGYILRDGVMAPLAEGARRVVKRDGPRPVEIEITAHDTLGRELHAFGREQVPAKFMLFPDRGQWWTLFKWDYDGFTGAIGEDQEFYGIYEFRKWNRAGPETWATR